MLTELSRLHEPRSEIILSDSLRICLKTIPEYDSWVEMRLVRRKTDNDLLFFIRDSYNDKYALRILGDRSYDYYCRCFYYQTQIDNAIGISKETTESLKYGLCRSGSFVYFMMPWQHDLRFDSVLKKLHFDDKLKPAASAAAYLRAASSIARQEYGSNNQDVLRFADSCNSVRWMEQIDDRVTKARRTLSMRGLEIAALDHFRGFYKKHRSVLASRNLTICYERFAPDMWYYQSDGSLRIPLITDWSFADEWYNLNSLFTDIHASCEDLAVLLIDFYFDFSPPEEFFICSTIYNVLNILEQLICCEDLQREDAKLLIRRLRAINQMYSKFTSFIPNWYKHINTAGK